MTAETHNLLNEFDAPAPGEWKKLAEEQLKGAPFEKKLVTRTPEGISLQPIYTSEDTQGLPHLGAMPGTDASARGTSPAGYRAQPWLIAQEIPYGEPSKYNKALLQDLEHGQTALNLLIDIATTNGHDPDRAGPGEVGACGLSLSCLQDLETALQGVFLDAIPLQLQSFAGTFPVAAMLFALAKKKDIPLEKLSGALGMDPLAQLARSGDLPASLSQLYAEMAILTGYCAEKTPAITTVGVNTLPYHESGASSVEELGIALATGVEYMRELIDRGVSPDTAAAHIRFNLAIGPHVFMEIAKFRAARIAWARAAEAFGAGPKPAKLKLHCRTGIWNKTTTDPYVNMLRTTTEAFAAAIGGCESLHVSAFNEIQSLPSDFDRRIARNQSIVLQKECELDRSIDPAGGSYFIETLTAQVAEKAWAFFQEIEKQGGITKALQSGFIQQRINATSEARIKNINQRKSILVGTNMYANAQEKPLANVLPDNAELHNKRSREMATYRIGASHHVDKDIMDRLRVLTDIESTDSLDAAIEAVAAGATIGEITASLRHADDGGRTHATPVCPCREASHYERLRNASTEYAKFNGTPPRLFLANMGPLREHKARADFTRGFFEPGGFEVLYPDGFDSVEKAAKAAKASDALLTVICSTDDNYAETVPALCKALKEAQPKMSIILAGHPGDNEAAWREAGLDDYIFIKSDNYAVLQKYLHKLGVVS